MGFFDKIFGKKEVKPIELRLESVQQFFSDSVAGRSKELDLAVASKLAEIKHLLRQLHAGLDELRKADAQSDNKRLQQIVSTAKSNAERQLAALVEKLQPPAASEPAVVRRYCIDASALLQREIGLFGKNIAYTSISFKQQVKNLGGTFRQLSECFSGLLADFSGASAVFLQQSVSDTVKDLRVKADAIEKTRKEIEELQNSIAAAEQCISGQQQALQRLQQSDEFAQINALNVEKAELLHSKQDAKTETIDLFSKVERPLHRMQKAVSAGKLSLEGELSVFLREVLTNPFDALRADPKAIKLKQLLAETEKAIEQGTIELKEKEREKRLAALHELIAFNFFDRVFWRFNQLDAQLAAVEKKLQQLPAEQKERNLLNELNQSKKEAEQMQEQLHEKKVQLKNLQQQQIALQQRLQSALSDATGKKVVLSIGD